MKTREIIQGCKDQKRSAQKELFMSYSNYLYGLILRYCGDAFRSKDILQEVFIIIFRAILKFEYENEHKFMAWMKTIAIRETLRQLKQAYNEMDSMEDVNNLEEEDKSISILSSLNVEDLLSLLADLPEGYRIIFNMYAIEGYSHKEIAKELAISESTSRSQLTRARKNLQELTLKKWKDER